MIWTFIHLQRLDFSVVKEFGFRLHHHTYYTWPTGRLELPLKRYLIYYELVEDVPFFLSDAKDICYSLESGHQSNLYEVL